MKYSSGATKEKRKQTKISFPKNSYIHPTTFTSRMKENMPEEMSQVLLGRLLLNHPGFTRDRKNMNPAKS